MSSKLFFFDVEMMDNPSFSAEYPPRDPPPLLVLRGGIAELPHLAQVCL